MNKVVGRGRPPFGYTSAGEPINRELDALIEVQYLLDQEAISLRDGADFVSQTTGKPITHTGLRDRLSKGIYLHGRDNA